MDIKGWREELLEEKRLEWFQFILDNPDKSWDWDEISGNPNISWKIVKDNPDKPWNWYHLSYNPNITLQYVKENPDKNWDWEWLSENPNIIATDILPILLYYNCLYLILIFRIFLSYKTK